MLRLLVVVVIAVAALWYFTRDDGSAARIAAEQREDLELAKQSAAMAETADAAMAAQADAMRDQAISGLEQSGSEDGTQGGQDGAAE